MEQPYGLIRFYDAKAKRIHQRDGNDVNPERIPILWNNGDRLPPCQFFTEIYLGGGTQTLTSLKVICNDESEEISLPIGDRNDFTKILCSAKNTSFYAWVYYSSSDLSTTIDDGIWFIEVTVNDGVTDQIFYSNKFVIET